MNLGCDINALPMANIDHGTESNMAIIRRWGEQNKISAKWLDANNFPLF